MSQLLAVLQSMLPANGLLTITVVRQRLEIKSWMVRMVA